MAKRSILLVEDTLTLAKAYQECLEKRGYSVKSAATGREALACLNKKHGFDLILLDIKLPDISGLDIISTLQKDKIDCPIIVMTGNGSMNTAIDAMRLGAQDFLVKPFQPEKLEQSIDRVLLKGVNDHKKTGAKNKSEGKPKDKKLATTEEQSFIGSSRVMRKIYKTIESAAKSSATVFITGDSGTGKEVCAERVHNNSSRAGGPFIALNCAAIPRELIESELFGHVKGAFTGAISDREGAVARANGGTLFLDEIGDMPLDMQTKLLRFLQNASFTKVGGAQEETTDARIICATNRNPLREVEEGRFREDLYYRLHVLPIHMPPLRARGDDIIEIAMHFLHIFSEKEGKSFMGYSDKVVTCFKKYDWPGNIRQLQNIVRHCVVMFDDRCIKLEMLPADIFKEKPKSFLHKNIEAKLKLGDVVVKPLREIEKDAILIAIEKCNGNIPKAAALLDVSPSTIYRKKTEWVRWGKEVS